MSAIIGIDLGTTNSVLSELVDGRPVPIVIDGAPIMPSVVLYLDDRVVVGREARNLELQYPERAVRSAKRRIGSDHRYTLADRTVSPEEVSAEVLRALVRGAEGALGRAVSDAVITVPAYFDDAQRKATLRAGELAGLNVLRLLNEPTAASLVYDHVGVGVAELEPELVLVFDLGGGTFDVSVLEVFEGVREVRATAGNTHLGGDDFDDKLVQHFLDALKLSADVDPREDLRAMARLRRLAEDTKIRLSTDVSVHVREEFLTTGREGRPVHLELDVSRRELEALIEPLLRATVEMAERALADAGLDRSELDRIVLVGGSTRIPLVRQLLREAFAVPQSGEGDDGDPSEQGAGGADIHDEIDPDLAVALGAAIQAGILSGAPVGRLLVDVAAHSLGIAVRSDRDAWDEADTFAPIIARNTVLPATRTEEFYTSADRQRALDVEVFQGERSRASQNSHIGSFTHVLEPRPHHSPVHVTFSYDLDGIVKVTIAQPGVTASEAVALAVADKAREAAPAPASAIERKGAELLGRLEGGAKATLSALLEAYRGASGGGRFAAEEALLDFFLDHGEG